MGRPARSSLQDGFFHVYARGVAGQPAFLDDDDRECFVVIFRLCERRHDWTCHALTLLSTHYHAVLETTRQNLSTGLKLLNSRYARRFNRRHNRFGHVFAERFQARVIESEEYLYDACSYVLQNPSRPGYVKPRKTGHGRTAGTASPPSRPSSVLSRGRSRAPCGSCS